MSPKFALCDRSRRVSVLFTRSHQRAQYQVATIIMNNAIDNNDDKKSAQEHIQVVNRAREKKALPIMYFDV